MLVIVFILILVVLIMILAALKKSDARGNEKMEDDRFHEERKNQRSLDALISKLDSREKR